MRTRLITWAMTFRWPPRWPFARFWATDGDVEAEFRENAKALELAETTIRTDRAKLSAIARGEE